MEPQGNVKLLERFAVARLQYQINELQTKVNYDKSLQPPVRKTFQCIADDSALTSSIAEFKRRIGDGTISMTVPLSTLDALDDLKKGTDIRNVNSRETIRYFERCQAKPIRGVKLQSPTEMYGSWSECEQFRKTDVPTPSAALSSPPTSPATTNSNWRRAKPEGSGAAGLAVPPKWIQPILNCALFKVHGAGERKPNNTEEDQIMLVTNSQDVQDWAKVFGLKAISTAELEAMIDQEEWAFREKMQNYEASVGLGSPTGGGGNGGRNGNHSKSGRGGGRGGGRRNSRGFEAPVDPEFSRGNHASPDYILRGPSRGVARGRGKLWEP